MDEALFDVVATHYDDPNRRRYMAQGLNAARADAVLKMAVHRRGVEVEFYKVVPHGSESIGASTESEG